jgi:hypothetical protein
MALPVGAIEFTAILAPGATGKRSTVRCVEVQSDSAVDRAARAELRMDFPLERRGGT